MKPKHLSDWLNTSVVIDRIKGPSHLRITKVTKKQCLTKIDSDRRSISSTSFA